MRTSAAELVCHADLLTEVCGAGVCGSGCRVHAGLLTRLLGFCQAVHARLLGFREQASWRSLG